MPYTINKHNGSQVTIVADGTVDSTLDLKLIGKNYAGYGEIQNENFVFLLENFAGSTQPAKPIAGQIWYDAAAKKLKVYDGAKFKTVSGADISSTAPVGLSTGDSWFDPTREQFFVWNGTGFVLIGPQNLDSITTYIVKTVDFIANVRNRYYIKNPCTVTLPDPVMYSLNDGDFVTFNKSPDIIVTIKSTVNTSIITASGTDTSIRYDLDDEIILVFDGANWRV